MVSLSGYISPPMTIVPFYSVFTLREQEGSIGVAHYGSAKVHIL
jgi:hypothetical protein